MAEKIKCRKCDKQATWVYAPHSCNYDPKAHYACENCVPRDCIHCGYEFIGKDTTGDIEGTTDPISNPELYEQHLDDQGRQIPCVEWWKELDGFDVAELDGFNKCEYCK